jgi:hypothetical protein
MLGPVLGAIIGVNLYGLLFAPKGGLVEEKVAAKTKPVSIRDSVVATESAKEDKEEVKAAKEAKTETKSDKKKSSKKKK